MCATESDVVARASLIHNEALMAFRLAARLESLLETRPGEAGYLREARGFFDYVREVCECSRAFCQKAQDTSAAPTPKEKELREIWAEDLAKIREDLVRIRRFLVLLHPIVRDALSATTLKIPFALVVVMNNLARRVVPKAQLLVTAAAEYNFLHDRMVNLRRAKSGGIFPDFPSTLGLVSFPHSEADAALNNCLLFHELGHFIYLSCDVETKLLKNSELLPESIQKALPLDPKRDKDLFGSRAEMLATRVRSLAKKWANEAFSDIVATEVLGPAHFLAFKHFLYAAPVPDERKFGVSHPAPLYRLALSWEILGDWQEVVTELTPEVGLWASEHSFAQIQVGADANVVAALALDDPRVCDRVVQWFHREVLPLVRKEARDAVAGVRAQPEGFLEFYEAVRENLAHCVSPLHRTVLKGSYRERAPVFLLNAAFIYHLTDFDNDWFTLFPKARRGKVQDAVELYDRFGLLILKALDDLLVYWEFKKR